MKTNLKTNKDSKPKRAVKKKIKKKSQRKANKLKNKILIFIGLIIILLIIGMLILFSDLFNIKQITVINNSKVTTQEIVSASGLVVGNNMFKSLKHTIKDRIKANPYIEDVNITKKLNGEIILDIEERNPTYMIPCEGGFAYINNQGYILETSR